MIELVVLDCDGTLVDSQYVIFESMRRALEDHALPVPPIEEVRRVVGLSLVEAAERLLPDLDRASALALATSYRRHFEELRRRDGVPEPLFPAVAETLATLDGRGVLLAVATGKSRRGLERVLAHHRLERFFVSLPTADDHPSKPHPAMLDVEMALAAGATPVGVAWGYHPALDLRRAGATTIIDRFADLAQLVEARA